MKVVFTVFLPQANSAAEHSTECNIFSKYNYNVKHRPTGLELYLLPSESCLHLSKIHN